jgi:ribosome biogenesis GTPase
MGLDADYNPRRLERYLLLAHAARVAPVVVLTKADLVAPSPAMREALVADETEALRARIGPQIPVLAVDGTSPEAALALAPWLLPGQTVVLLGSSGAGKSTLTNTLAGLSLQDTGAVRTHDSRGKHTTTARTLYRLPGGACVIDTPGLRALRPDLDEATLAQGFGDIDALAPRCRFRDCGHGDEPGCAVRESVAPDRLRNFHKLQRELKRDTMTALERQRQLAEWKARGRAGAQRWKQKRAGG